jgi:hypothetical protein
MRRNLGVSVRKESQKKEKPGPRDQTPSFTENLSHRRFEIRGLFLSILSLLPGRKMQSA